MKVVEESKPENMSLRDHFAGLAMQGWLASFDSDETHPVNYTNGAKDLANFSYQIADAMLEVRGLND